MSDTVDFLAAKIPRIELNVYIESGMMQSQLLNFNAVSSRTIFNKRFIAKRSYESTFSYIAFTD